MRAQVERVHSRVVLLALAAGPLVATASDLVAAGRRLQGMGAQEVYVSTVEEIPGTSVREVMGCSVTIPKTRFRMPRAVSSKVWADNLQANWPTNLKKEACMPREHFGCSLSWMWVESGCFGNYTCNGRNLFCGDWTARGGRVYCECLPGGRRSVKTSPRIVEPTTSGGGSSSSSSSSSSSRRRERQSTTRGRDLGRWSLPVDTPTPLHGSTLTIVGTHCHDSVDWLLDVLDEDDSTRASIYDCRLRELEKRVARHKRVEVIDKSGERVKLGAFWTYFHWIVTHYDNLPDWIVFMHGHDTSFEHRQMGAAQVVRNCKRLLVRPAGNRELSYSVTLRDVFINVGDAIWDTWLHSKRDLLVPCHSAGARHLSMIDMLEGKWDVVKDLLAERDAILPPNHEGIAEINSAEALVGRARLLRRSKSHWGRLLNATANAKYHADLLFEGVFHRIMGESWSRPFIKERFHEMARVSANCTTFLKTRGYNELSLRTLDAERVENAGPAGGVAHVPSTIDGGDRSSSSNGVGGGGHSMRHVESLLTQLISEVRGLRSDWVSGKIPTPPATGAAGGEVTHSAGSDGGSGGGSGGGGSGGGDGGRRHKAGRGLASSGARCCEWDPKHTTGRQGPGCGAPNAPPLREWLDAPTLSRGERRVLQIGMNHGSAGFFAFVLFAINQLRFADEHGLTPYVDFGECTTNGEDHFASGGANLFYDARLGPNMWDYYFEPVSDYRPGDPGVVHRLSSTEMWRLHHKHPESVFAYPYGMYKQIARATPADRAAWYRTMRTRAHGILRRHVRVKRSILDEADREWAALLARRGGGGGGDGPILGVHVRATDKEKKIGGDIVRPSSYYRHIDACLREAPSTAIFLATDSPSVVAEMRARYPGRLLVRGLARSEKNAIFDTAARTATAGSRQGRDVLIDAILLSRTDGLLKSSSAVSEFAAWYAGEALLDRTADLQFEEPDGPPLRAVCGRRPDRPRPADGAAAGHGGHGGDAGGAGGGRRSVPLRCLPSGFMTANAELLEATLESPEVLRCIAKTAAGSVAPLTPTVFAGHVADAVAARSRGGCEWPRGRPLYKVELLTAGWFSTVNGAVKPLMHALVHGGALVPPPIAAFTAPSCRTRDLTCFFRSTLPECAPPPQEEQQERLRLRPPTTLLDEMSEAAFQKGALRDGALATAYRERGWFGWSSQVLAFLMRPNDELRRAVTRARDATGLTDALARGRVVGLHVRHGDSCLDTEKVRMARTCEPLSAYMPHVRRVARLVGATSVYLATDSARVLADARLYASEFSFHTMNLSSAYESHDTLWDKKVRTRLRDGLAERSFREAWEATVDMMLLSECDGFVGKFTSNFFRNAYSLKAAACDCAPPFVSLDAPWCFDYGLRVGFNPHLKDAEHGGRFWC